MVRVLIPTIVSLVLPFAAAAQDGAPMDAAKGPPPTPVKVAEAREESLAPRRKLFGEVRASQRSTVATEEGGVVREVLVAEGVRVAKGAPIGQAFIEPTLSTDNLVSVNARAPNPAVARLLLDFALSVPGQAILNADGFSPRTGVPGTRPLPTLSEADPQATRAETPQMLALLGLA
jgi:multidrug efflux pump subunit AcrA (membrane-fusion protein)